ncbi:hypothetical protein K490DRAFT_60074 [Saccharata proteae CBS 121410]|uniref:Uncharacterized protein n=1 Tax=Saccharata proteae CBS 121410 TaxID=1314787 RepID=A0A9P4LWC9_9PEZI|nr:hypothetical protein K490DRAFT_60074 [Saccharata proteae CBS 121410]
MSPLLLLRPIIQRVRRSYVPFGAGFNFNSPSHPNPFSATGSTVPGLVGTFHDPEVTTTNSFATGGSEVPRLARQFHDLQTGTGLAEGLGHLQVSAPASSSTRTENRNVPLPAGGTMKPSHRKYYYHRIMRQRQELSHRYEEEKQMPNDSDKKEKRRDAELNLIADHLAYAEEIKSMSKERIEPITDRLKDYLRQDAEGIVGVGLDIRSILPLGLIRLRRGGEGRGPRG